jgi:alkaline phosphatase
MKKLLFCLFSCCSLVAMAQPKVYTTANAHSHNDYEKPFPFKAAYGESFGSMEADLHLINDTLWVSHNRARPGIDPTFDVLYLRPLDSVVKKNNGFPYADHSKKLQLLIDIKTAAVPTLDKVVAYLRQYPRLINNPHIHFVISGGRPDPNNWNQYPSFIWFDGNIGQSYPKAALDKIALMSADFHKYSKWNGTGSLAPAEQDTIQGLIAAVHLLGKPVRFWATPDNSDAWVQLMKWKIDYLNTDHITELSAFLKKQAQAGHQ